MLGAEVRSRAFWAARVHVVGIEVLLNSSKDSEGTAAAVEERQVSECQELAVEMVVVVEVEAMEFADIP